MASSAAMQVNFSALDNRQPSTDDLAVAATSFYEYH